MIETATPRVNLYQGNAALILKSQPFFQEILRPKSGASQHAIDRFFRGERIHPGTRKKFGQNSGGTGAQTMKQHLKRQVSSIFLVYKSLFVNVRK
jgi:hypothetical protein